MNRWDVLTGEYPPEPGGVADYTRLVAEGLAGRGADVHVWTTPTGANADRPDPRGVTVHRVENAWSRSGRRALDRALGPPGEGRRLLAQYTPNAWGRKGANLAFCGWLAGRGRAGDALTVMFHEVAYYVQPRDRLARRVLPLIHMWMLRRVVAGCLQVDYAAGEWGRRLAPLAARHRVPTRWTPVPSNVPVVDDPAAVAALRRSIAPDGQTIVGAFGTYGDDLRNRLLPVFARVVLARPGRVGLLIGRHAERFAAEAVARDPEFADRLVVTGALEPADLSRHIQACDVLVQPYPHGVCGRRGTAMACLAHGSAIATNFGPFTEPPFLETPCADFAPADDPGALALAAETLLADPTHRARVAASAADLYAPVFALDRTLDALLEVGLSVGWAPPTDMRSRRKWWVMSPRQNAADTSDKTPP